MIPLLFAICYLLFAALAVKRLHWAVLLTIVALPTYLVRFTIGPIPMTLLEGLIVIVFAVWLLRQLRTYGAYQSIKTIRYTLGAYRWPLALFLIAATASVFVAPDLRAAAGIWKAYFIEPVLFFLVLRDLLSKNSVILNETKRSEESLTSRISTGSLRQAQGRLFAACLRRQALRMTPQSIITALSFTALVLSLYAIYQRFTGVGIPAPWDTELRVTSIFPYPNALGLFLAPLIPLFLMQFFAAYQRRAISADRPIFRAMFYWLIVLLLSTVAIVFAKSTGAIVGIVAGIFIMAVFYFVQAHHAGRQESSIRNQESWKRKSIIHNSLFIIPLAIIVILSINAWVASPLLRNELTLRDWSGHVRRMQWSETIAMLKDRPILGAGLAGYKEALDPYHKATYLEIFEYPHNIVLNFWSETGLVGLLAFAWLVIIFFTKNIKLLKIKRTIFSDREKSFAWYDAGWVQIGALGAMTALLVHGLVDVPYFKNDLAILFWIIFALGMMSPELPRLPKKGSA